jgi:hypothetical protein
LQKFIEFNTVVLAAIPLKNSAKGPCDAIRNEAADQPGSTTLTMPSYKKCQPIDIRKIIKAVACQFEYALFSIPVSFI